MRAAILAGGKGTRVEALYPDLPKPMFPIAGKPLLQHHVEALASQGINNITLTIGYKADVIRKYFGDGSAFGVHIDYIVEDEPLGSGGALSLLPREDTLILLGDVYFNIDLGRFINFHKEKQASITLFAHPNSHPHDSDIIVTNTKNRVIEWKSKNDKQRGDLRNLVNAGMYIFSRDTLPIGEAVKRDLEHDLILPILSEGKVFAYRSTEYIKDMGTPERLKVVERDFQNGITEARNLKNKQKAIFLDRDGTLNKEYGFISNPEHIQLLPDVAEAVHKINASPFLAICITNQPVIARGEASFAGLAAIHARLDTLLGQNHAYLDDLFFCPHHPDKGFDGEVPEYKIKCDCRKPSPGLLLEAAKTYNIDLSESYMIGDRSVDIGAGLAAGCKDSIICKNLLTVVQRILAGEKI